MSTGENHTANSGIDGDRSLEGFSQPYLQLVNSPIGCDNSQTNSPSHHSDCAIASLANSPMPNEFDNSQPNSQAPSDCALACGCALTSLANSPNPINFGDGSQPQNEPMRFCGLHEIFADTIAFRVAKLIKNNYNISKK